MYSQVPTTIETYIDTENVDEADITTLRIRTETGQHTYEMKMAGGDSIAQVLSAIEPYSETKQINKFELRSTHPNRAYEASEP